MSEGVPEGSRVDSSAGAGVVGTTDASTSLPAGAAAVVYIGA